MHKLIIQFGISTESCVLWKFTEVEFGLATLSMNNNNYQFRSLPYFTARFMSTVCAIMEIAVGREIAHWQRILYRLDAPPQHF